MCKYNLTTVVWEIHIMNIKNFVPLQTIIYDKDNKEVLELDLRIRVGVK